jgi:hypothetical protein
MLFRQRDVIDALQLEELRRQDARRAVDRECRVLRRQYSALDKEHRLLREELERQGGLLDSMTMQLRAMKASKRGPIVSMAQAPTTEDSENWVEL